MTGLADNFKQTGGSFITDTLYILQNYLSMSNEENCLRVIREFIYGIYLIAVENGRLPHIRWYFVKFLVSF